MKILDNRVDEFWGLDKARYTNAVPIDSVKIGGEVTVFDLSSYVNPPDTPCKGIIVDIFDYPYIVVDINGGRWEVYEEAFGYEINKSEI